MKKVRVYQVDAFTNEQFQGNPAGVVLDASGLDTAQMQKIASEMNCSETAFMIPSDRPSEPLQIRYFTPMVEVPLCGHATIAAMHVWAKEWAITDDTQIQIQTGAGVLPIEIQPVMSGYQITMSQQTGKLGNKLSQQDQQMLLSALELHQEEINPSCPVQIVSIENSFVYLCIHSRDRLNQLTPRMDLLKKLSHHLGCNGYFVFTFDTPDPDIFTYGRMFAPAIGIEEDPVTGTAHIMLGAYLVHHQLVSQSEAPIRFAGKQGEAMNRIGRVDVTVYCEGPSPYQVQIGGQAVVVFETEMTL